MILLLDLADQQAGNAKNMALLQVLVSDGLRGVLRVDRNKLHPVFTVHIFYLLQCSHIAVIDDGADLTGAVHGALLQDQHLVAVHILRVHTVTFNREHKEVVPAAAV